MVIVHEWNEPWLVARIGRARRRGGRFTLLFHDTHHRAVSDPDAIRAFDLDGYDGVLAFGETLSEVYRRWGWGDRVFIWHEAADTRLFQPPAEETRREGLVWIGNWGDDERSAELESFLLRPARTVGLPLDIYGVRYPEHALDALRRYGARYRGWLPNARAPEVFAAISRPCTCRAASTSKCCPASRPSASSRRWPAASRSSRRLGATRRDCSAPGEDYLVAHDEAAMERHLAALRDDPALRARARRERPRDDPRAPHLRPPRRRASRDRRSASRAPSRAEMFA